MLWRRLAYNTSLVERLDEEVEPLVSLLTLWKLCLFWCVRFVVSRILDTS